MLVTRVVHQRNPYVASREADAEGRRIHDVDPARLRFFVEREVLLEDGTFPYGEGFLYRPERRRIRDEAWSFGGGRPGRVFVAGHRGTCRQQQDAFAARRYSSSGREVAVLVVADGVSQSGARAKVAARQAVEAFMERFPDELGGILAEGDERHAQVERALTRAAYASNFEVVRQALFGDGRYDARDRETLLAAADVDLPTGPLSHAAMRSLAGELAPVVEKLAEEDVHALTTFAVAVSVDDDVYCFTTGDAVIGLYRPTEPAGERFLHLTHRDQAVVELFRDEDPALNLEQHEDTFENIITDSLGGSTKLSGTLRRYEHLLARGDRLLAFSDGLGARGGGGLDRKGVERALEGLSPRQNPARALVRAQLADLSPGDYQDNIGVALLVVR